MRIIEQSAELIKHDGSPYELIETVARTCYKSESRGNPLGFVKGLQKSHHWAMLEHEYVYFKLDGIAKYNFLNQMAPEELKFINVQQNYVSGSFRSFLELAEPYADTEFTPSNRNNIVLVEMIRQLTVEYPDVFTFNLEDCVLKASCGTVELMSRQDFINDIKSVGYVLEDCIISALIPHTIRFITNRGCCYDDQTQVLTDKGFKYFKDLKEDDLIMSLDDNNNLEYVKPLKYICEYYEGDMHHWHSTQIDCMVTPNHNMWLFDYHKRSVDSRIWKFIKSEDANNKRYMFNKSSNGTLKQGYSKFIIPATYRNHAYNSQRKFSEVELSSANLFFELVGLWMTDGCLSYGRNGSGNKVVITQCKAKVKHRLRYLLGVLHIKYQEKKQEFSIACPQLFSWLEENFIHKGDNKKTYYLTLPRWIFDDLSKSNLEYLLKGIIEGDGSPHTKGKGYQIYTASENFAKDLVELALYIGVAANYYTVEPRDRIFPEQTNISHCQKQYVVSLVVTGEHLFSIKNKTGKDTVKYKGMIYCVELPRYHRLFILRNGKGCWCGNSHEIVRHRPCSFAQESQRYVGYDKDKYGSELTVIKPLIEENSKDYEEWKYAIEWCETVYMNLRSRGVQPQIARGVLPNDCKTEIVVTATEQEWQHIMDLRFHGITGAPHPQIKALMGLAYPILAEESEGRIK